MKRKCSMCEGYKEEEQFRYMKKQDRYNCYCKDCERLYNKEYQRIYREEKEGINMDLDDDELLATRILNGVEKKKANTDNTYCKNESCSKKCWRHISNYRFDNDKDYWLMEMCEEERKRIEKLLGVKE